MNEDEVTVLYSGGTDSTLAAALMCMRFRKVRLLTYRTSVMSHLENTKLNVKLLQKKFGRDKITHELIDSDKIFRMLYRGNYLQDVKKYKTYLSACLCFSCNLSWHVKTIIYDIENNIHFTCDGERYEKPPLWAELMPEVLQMVRDLYKEYSITYENPVYNIKRTDWKLFELGITSEKNVKLDSFSRVVKGYSRDPWKRWHATQQHCSGGIVGALFLSCYFVPLYGQKVNEKIGIEYYKDKIDVCRKHIENYLRNKKLS